MITKYNKKDVDKFLKESNGIEGVFTVQALKDAIKAWDYLKMKSFLTPEVILGVHHILMKNLNPDIAGFWRNCDVWIGGQKKKFVSVQLIEKDIEHWISLITYPKIQKELDPDKYTRHMHVLFEGIHPFIDGNGRTGRLIYLWHRMQLGLPIHIIHADIEEGRKEQWEYYQWFRN